MVAWAHHHKILMELDQERHEHLKTKGRIEEQREVNDLLREFIWHKGLEREMLEWLLDKRGVSLAKRMTHADLYGPPVATKGE